MPLRVSRSTIVRQRCLAILVCVCASECLAREPNSKVIPQARIDHLAYVDFDRHIASLLGRLGCNSAACHGSFQGKGGLRLSLFGQSPSDDYKALTGVQRVDPQSPDRSRLLIKATGGEDHGGGVRFAVDSWEYRLFRRWIAGGVRTTSDKESLVGLTIVPAEVPVLRPDQTCQLTVVADFTDGTREDVTSFSEFRSRDEAVVKIDTQGHLTALQSGTTSLIVSYRGKVLGLPVIVPYGNPSRAEFVPSENVIDQEIHAQLQRCGLTVSPSSDDAEFLRRVTLDVIGIIPSVEEAEEFLSDTNPLKRSQKIDELLRHPRRAISWASRFCELTACNVDHLDVPEHLRPRRAKMWHDWFRKRFAENIPYDQLVKGVLCAVSRGEQPLNDWIDSEIALEDQAKSGFASNYQDRTELDLFWKRIGEQGPLPVEDYAELIGSAFLGIRLHCARCHQHPYDHWTQFDFAGFANVFARVEYGSSTDLRTVVMRRLQERREARRAGQTLTEFPRVQEVFVSNRPRSLVDALSASTSAPKAPGGPLLPDVEDPREALFAWLIQPGNAFFAPNFVNRTWARYFGTGLVEPVDDFSTGNPPTHPQLLSRLSAEFVRSGFDIQYLERQILNSQTYQRTSSASGNNAVNHRQLARMPVRPLPAEVLIDSLNQALESFDDFGKDAPPGCQALELAVNRVSNPAIQSMFQVLGRPERKVLCDCERSNSPTVRRELFLLSDSRVMAKITQGRLARRLKQETNDASVIRELYLAILSRPPSVEELQFHQSLISLSEVRAAGFVDLVWALINSQEFTTNH